MATIEDRKSWVTDCFVLIAVGYLVHSADANQNGGIVLLISKGLEKTCVTLKMLPQNSAQGKSQAAAPKRVASQCQKLPLSACDKERVGGEKNHRGLGTLR